MLASDHKVGIAKQIKAIVEGAQRRIVKEVRDLRLEVEPHDTEQRKSEVEVVNQQSELSLWQIQEEHGEAADNPVRERIVAQKQRESTRDAQRKMQQEKDHDIWSGG